MKNPGGHEYNLIPILPSQIRYADYQRGGVERHIEHICETYDGDVQNEPKLSYRDNVYWCFDGQQTISAWTRKFGDTPIQCKVYMGLTYLDEARLFAIQSNNLKIQPLKIFDSELKGHDVEAMAIRDAVEAAGYHIPLSAAHGNDVVQCIGTLKKVYSKIGYEGVCEIMNTIGSAWGYAERSTDSLIVGGMAKFYTTYHGEYKMKDLVSSLRKNGCCPNEILTTAVTMAGRRSALNIARVILSKYNHGRNKNRLPDKL